MTKDNKGANDGSPALKKRKVTTSAAQSASEKKNESIKPIKKMSPVTYTVCVPSTCISRSNTKNLQQVTHVAYQLARTCTAYNVGEIVVLDIPEERNHEKEQEQPEVVSQSSKKIKFNFDDNATITNGNSQKHAISDSAMLLATLLQFFITPPYLRKASFKHDSLKNFEYAKKLPKLSNLPFMSNNKVYNNYKEGLTIHKKAFSKKKNNSKLEFTKYVNIGEKEALELNGPEVPVNVRVTVDLKEKKIISPIDAYGIIGAKSSFGYHVRIAKSFSSVFTESSYSDGYSQSVYINCGDYFYNNKVEFKELTFDTQSGNILLIFGKWTDLDSSFQNDKELISRGIESAKEMIDGELKIVEGCRVEDGVLIGLTKIDVLKDK
ncbi:hypothetical protein PACTADRAFT_63451 [Pachysolen tannophilus NRRL Y-2460]|uniref:DUF171-domain-containing protein n=1 Tax=Pachysolen tannophilus NRRL Y-2460 TaxID=669874 RepID=A0A1E4U1G4_PACTA|nr:hypothetical protein PACTADRAFT_63451 [Pachysolen tannophilus NRRL Y-2460]